MSKQELLKALGARIKSERLKKGITLEKLAYEMSISKGNLSDIENGKKDPRYTTLRLLSKGIGVSLAHLLKDS